MSTKSTLLETLMWSYPHFPSASAPGIKPQTKSSFYSTIRERTDIISETQCSDDLNLRNEDVMAHFGIR